MRLMTTWKRLKHGCINGKPVSMPLPWGRHTKLYFHGEEVNSSSWHYFLRNFIALTKNIWECFLIANLILMNKLKEYLIKLVNLLVLFASYETFYRDHLDKSINLLLDLTYITVILSMTRLWKYLFKINLNPFNIM